MFRCYYFSEMPYPFVPSQEFTHVARTTMPNRWFDPDAGFEVYHKYFDLVLAADELGLDVMFNEHHSTLSNMNAVMPLTMAIAARETKHCRILALGNPVANRPDPVRVAEEMAMIDVVSHGRLDCGFVRGVSNEMSATNATPIDMKRRLYEAIDLIVKAWTEREGSFNWEGEFFQHRQVDIVPRPYQQPHPPIWITTLSASSGAEVADRGYTIATIFNGKKACAEIFNTYRGRVAERGLPPPHPDKFAYCNFTYVGETDEEALQEAPKVQDFLRQSGRTAPGQQDVPGYTDPPSRAAALRELGGQDAAAARVVVSPGYANPLDLTESGIGFFGSPDSVFEQMRDFFYAVGGYGNHLAMFHASTMTHRGTRRSMELYSKHVLPRFREEVYEPWIKQHGLKTTIGVSRNGSGDMDLSREAGFVTNRPA